MAKQQQQQGGQALTAQAQQHKTKLTAVGCPDPVADQVAQHLAGQGGASGVTADHVTRLASAAQARGVAFNWNALQGLLQLLGNNGPAIIDAITALFGGGAAGAAPRGAQP